MENLTKELADAGRLHPRVTPHQGGGLNFSLHKLGKLFCFFEDLNLKNAFWRLFPVCKLPRLGCNYSVVFRFVRDACEYRAGQRNRNEEFNEVRSSSK
jgi:hypothetical protein